MFDRYIKYRYRNVEVFNDSTSTKYLPYSKLKTTKKQKTKFYNGFVVLDQYTIFICIFILFIFIVHKPVAYIVFNT